MSEESTVQPVVEPIVEKPVTAEPVAPEEKEFRFEYQPKDENGKALGGVQVVVAKNPEEALQKMADQNQELIRLSRKLKRDLRLGVVSQENIPDTAPRFHEGQYEFNPAPLSAEERLEIIRDINDPENFDKAAARIVKSQIGDPEQIRGALSRAEQKIAAIEAQEQAKLFVQSTPQYYVCQENFLTLANWMIKNNLEPVKENYVLAFNTLHEAGLMIDRPEPTLSPVVETKSTPVVEKPATEPASARPVSSGLTRSQSSDNGVPTKTGYTPAEIDKMSADEYRDKILRPAFRAQRVPQ
jgi:hypothetical protein